MSQAQLRGAGIQSRAIYKSSQARQQRQQKEQEQLSKDVQDTVKSINEGRITSYEQIPSNVRQYIDVDRNYFEQKKQYEKALLKQKAAQEKLAILKRVEKLAKKGVAAGLQDLPKYARDYYREVKEGLESQRMAYAKKEVAYFDEQGLGYSVDPAKATPDLTPKVIFAEPVPTPTRTIPAGAIAPTSVQIANKELLEDLTPKKPSTVVPKTTTSSYFVPSIQIKGKDETYQAGVGFVSTSPTGEQGTPYIRPPTMAEQAKIDKRQENLFMADLGKIGKEPEIKTRAGFFGGRELTFEEKSQFKDLPKTIALTKAISLTAGGTVEAGLKKIGFKDIALPKPKILLYEKPQKLFGMTKATPESIGKAAELSVDIGKYAVPVAGTTLFAMEVGGELRKYDYNPIEFAKAEPTQAATLGAIALTAGVAKVGKFAFGTKIIESKEGFRVTNRFNEAFLKNSGRKFTQQELSLGKVTEINVPKPIGFDKGKGVVYPEEIRNIQKISGRQTIVSEKGFFGNEKILYKGNPYVDPKGYTKQLEFLKKKGILESNAKDILRFSAPKAQITKDTTTIITSKNVGVGISLQKIEQPVIDLGAGIKTRGKQTTYELTPFTRVAGKDIVLESRVSTLFTLPKKNAINLRGFNFQEGISFVESSRVKPLSKKFSGIGIQDLSSTSVTRNKPFGWDNKLFIDSGGSNLISKIPKEQRTGFVETTGKKSSQEYLEQLYGQELKTAPKLKTIKEPKKPPKLKTETITTQETKNIPLMVGGEGVTTSQFVGTGLYERTEEIGGFKLPTTTKSLGETITKTDTGVKSAIDINLKSLQPEVIKTVETPKIEVLPKVRQAQTTELLSETKTDTISRTELKQLARTLSTPKTIQPTKMGKTPPTKIPKGKFTFKLPKGETKTLSKKERRGLFKVIGKRFGKEKIIKQTKTLGQAEKSLEKFLTKTLGASGRILENGKRIKATELSLLKKEGFRKAKRDPFTVVEIKERRLKKGTKEVPEIQTFRKKTKKKRKNIFGI